MKHIFSILLLLSMFNASARVESISMVGCEDMAFVHKNKILPGGSALITSSGNLKAQGITAIIHAGTASWKNRTDEPYNPTLKRLTDSVMNSMILADRFGHKRVAIPFLGGGVFFKNLKLTLDDLAEAIVRTSYENANGAELVFISIDQAQVDAFKRAVRHLNDPKLEVVKGSITDFNAHKSPAIVNSGNMEMIFGTGLSGAIAKATGKKAEIDAEAKKMILAL